MKLKGFLRTFGAWIWAGMLCVNAPSCTIFVLVDSEHTLFFNNEDWENPRTRLWFVPAGKDFYGCAYVGFDDGWAQGGLNTEGLAFDWVAGFNDQWEPPSGLNLPRGNSSQRMLEKCKTVEEAIAFYRANREPGFWRARILIADRSGASVIIGARNGELLVEKSGECRGFGYGREVIDKMLAEKPKATVKAGVKILRAAAQRGQYATKYSNVFNLRSGDIYMFDLLRGEDKGVTLNLAEELAKGPHYFDIPELKRQVSKPAKTLLRNMERLPLDKFKATQDDSPEIRERMQRVLKDGASGKLREKDFTPKLWKELSGQLPALQAELVRLGDLREMTRVEGEPQDVPRSYRYRVDFLNATVLQCFVLDENGKIASIQSEDVEQRPQSGK